MALRQLKIVASLALAAFLSCIAVVSHGHARVVTIEGAGRGSGYLFNHRGLCYVLVPLHVGSWPTFSVRTGLPERTGQVAGRRFYSEEMDIRLSIVRGDGIGEICGLSWSALPADSSRALQVGAVVQMRSARPGQREDGPQMRITRVDHERFQIAPLRDERASRIQAGTSGSVVMLGEDPLGIVVEAPNDGEPTAIVLRMDAIVNRIDRLMDGAPRADYAAAPSTPTGLGLPFRVADFNNAGLPDYPVINLDSANTLPYIAALGARPITIALAFEGDKSVSVTGVRLVSLKGAGEDVDASVPRAVVIKLSARPDGRGSRNFYSGDMPPDGTLTKTKGVGSFARRVIIELKSGWEAGKPLRLDTVVVEGHTTR